MTMLTIDNLSKQFGGYQAVDAISLQVARGEIFGFLGPNGAGKTTTIKMLAGLLIPDSGRIHIDGRELTREPLFCKQNTGYIADRPWLFEKLSGREYLQFMASLYGMKPENFRKESEHYLTLFDLHEWQDQLIESYSHGMRQKLIMSSVLMLDQPLLIIDEPMVGLDPKSARIVKELFRKRAREGTAIFLSTHSLEIAEELCDRIAIITRGRLRVMGTVEELRREAGSGDQRLEDIFLELTGAWELQSVINALRSRP